MNDDKDILSFRYKFDIDTSLFPVRKNAPPSYVIGAAMKVNDTWVEYIINNGSLADYLEAIREYNNALDRWRESTTSNTIK